MLSTIANLDSFRLAEEEAPEPSDTTTTGTLAGESAGVPAVPADVLMGRSGNDTAESGEAVERRSPNSGHHNSTTPGGNHHHPTNAVNKKDELETGGVVVVGINHNSPCSDSRQAAGGGGVPPPVRPKPPTATKPVPHNLPNYTSERGAGRGGPSAGGPAHGVGMVKGRSQRGEQQQQQQQQPQSNQGAASGGNAAPGAVGSGGGGGGSDAR